MVSEKKDLEKRTRLKESYIPRLIIWVPIGSIIITALIISTLFIASYNQFLKIENINLRDRLLEDGRLLIREEVEEIINYIDFNISNAEEWLKEELKERVDLSFSIVESIYEHNSPHKSEVEIIDIIRETLRDVRFFDGRGYYFIQHHDLSSSNYTVLQPRLEWNYQLDDKDLDGQLISETAHDLFMLEGEGFLTFNYDLDDQNIKEKKLTYVKLFEPLDIFIGTGEYLHYFEEEIKKDVLLWLENYRFGDNNYLFIYNTEGTILMHPIIPELVHRNIGDLKDSDGYEFGKEYLKSSASDSGIFVSYTWPFPDTGEEMSKVGYAKVYKDWNWNIGTGMYMNLLEEIIIEGQNNLSTRIRMVTFRTVLIVSLLIFVVSIVTLIFAKFTASLFNVYNRHIRESSDELKALNVSLEKKVKAKTLELEIKNNELEQLVITDSLSGIYNRRYFDFTLKKEWYRHMRNESIISLIMCDIDFFKQYNDTYGHQKGDECIKIVGSIVKKICKRPIDIPVRYGGEEFALILPQTNLEGASQISSEIQSELNSLQIEHTGSVVGNNLSISIGISSIVPEKGHDYTEIIGFADAALYRAKANGRNRIES